jgi:hypothetical protein
MKLDLVRQLAGTRYQIAPAGSAAEADDFLAALNQIFVVFHDPPKVIAALDAFKRDLGKPNNMAENLPRLFRELFASLGLKYETLSDQFILTPFTQGPVLQTQSKK